MNKLSPVEENLIKIIAQNHPEVKSLNDMEKCLDGLGKASVLLSEMGFDNYSLDLDDVIVSLSDKVSDD